MGEGGTESGQLPPHSFVVTQWYYRDRLSLDGTGHGTSLQCVAPPVQRAGLLAGSGTAGLCDGAFAQDLNALWCPSCPKSAKNPGAGATVQAQLWYRDAQSTSNQTTSLSDAIEFTLAP